MTEDVESIFLNEKPVKILVTLRRNRQDLYGSKIAKKVDTTYAHCVKTLSTLEEKGFITRREEGRKNIVELTDKGEEAADLFGKIIDTTSDWRSALAVQAA